jgi:predicted PurR-regulated permease PerM
MNRQAGESQARDVLVGMAAIVIIVAGLKAASSLMIPFLTAAFLAVICSPSLQWCRRKGLSAPLSFLAVAAAATVVLIGVAAVVGSSVRDFASNIDHYESQLGERKGELMQWAETRGIEISQEWQSQSTDPQRAMRFFGGVMSSVAGLLSNAFLVLLTLIFILLEAAGFSRKLVAISGGTQKRLERAERIVDAVNHYVSIKTWVSLLTGTIIALWLWILKVDYAVLWGLMAFLFNFVPNIGSIIAAVPAVLLALIDPGPTAALYAAGGYVVVNVVVGNVIEPRVMGKGLGLSTLVVFLSLVFWGWVFGPVGMLLSVPLTMIVKIVLEAHPETAWIAILLGQEPEEVKDAT